MAPVCHCFRPLAKTHSTIAFISRHQLCGSFANINTFWFVFILKLQRYHRWNSGMDRLFHATLYLACDDLSMFGFKSIVKGFPVQQVYWRPQQWIKRLCKCLKYAQINFDAWYRVYIAIDGRLGRVKADSLVVGLGIREYWYCGVRTPSVGSSVNYLRAISQDKTGPSCIEFSWKNFLYGHDWPTPISLVQCQSALLFLRYSYYKIWPRKSTLNAMRHIHGQGKTHWSHLRHIVQWIWFCYSNQGKTHLTSA